MELVQVGILTCTYDVMTEVDQEKYYFFLNFQLFMSAHTMFTSVKVEKREPMIS